MLDLAGACRALSVELTGQRRYSGYPSSGPPSRWSFGTRDAPSRCRYFYDRSVSRALVVVDVQVGLVAEAYEGDRFLARVVALRHRAGAAGAATVFVQHDGDGELAPGSSAWQLHPALAVRPDDVVVRKRSADSFYDTNLSQILRERGTTELVVAGYASEYCVDGTCRSALAHGFDVVLAADAHSTFDRPAAPQTGGLTAAQAIAHHTWLLATMAQPRHTLTVLPVDQIHFGLG